MTTKIFSPVNHATATVQPLYDFTLHIYKEKTNEIDLTKVAQEFIAVNDRRKSFLGHFKEYM